jgi:hypothetical protein
MEGYHLRTGETVAVEAMVRRKEYFHLRSRPARLFAAAADNEHPSSSITCGWMDGGISVSSSWKSVCQTVAAVDKCEV